MFVSTHLKYLKLNCSDQYDKLCGNVMSNLKANNYSTESIEILMSIKEKLSFLLYNIGSGPFTDYDLLIDRIVAKLNELEFYGDCVQQYRALVENFRDRRSYNVLSWFLEEERKQLTHHLHNVKDEKGCKLDMQKVICDMDYIEFIQLAKYRQNCVVQQDLKFCHEIGEVQMQLETFYEVVTKDLNDLRQEVYLYDKEVVTGLRYSNRNIITGGSEKNLDTEVEKCRIRTDYLLFAMRHWINMCKQIQVILAHDSTIIESTQGMIGTLEDYLQKIIKLSFVMIRQPDQIVMMQTPSTQRMLRDKEFIKGALLAYNSSSKSQWIQLKSKPNIFLIGLNEYKANDSVFDDFSPNRDKAYVCNLYEPTNRQKQSTNNPEVQDFHGNEVSFPRVHMINHYLKRRCKEMTPASNKRKHDDNQNAAPEELFSFIVSFNLEYTTSMSWLCPKECSRTSKQITVQTCSRPVAMLVHASQKPPAEGKLFWSRFNQRWEMPFHEVSSVAISDFRKKLQYFTNEQFGRLLSDRELDYLMMQIPLDSRSSNRVISKAVLKDEALYTDKRSLPKRPSFWIWFYESLMFLCKGRGKPATRSTSEPAIKRHWKEGRICFLSRAQAQETFQELGPCERGAIFRVSESQSKTLNLLSYNNSWGVPEKEIEAIDEKIGKSFMYLWSETEKTWKRTDLVCHTKTVPKDPNYKPFGDGINIMSPMSPPPIASPYSTPYPSVTAMDVKDPMCTTPNIPSTYASPSPTTCLTPLSYPSPPTTIPNYYPHTPQAQQYHCTSPGVTQSVSDQMILLNMGNEDNSEIRENYNGFNNF